MVPYIGITDFTDYSQVEAMLAVFNAHRPPGSKRKLHVGVMMSYKTLNDLPTRWSMAFPPKEGIASVFSSTETYNCLHYADYGENNYLADHLLRAVSYGGEHLHALQLDMTWPNYLEVANFLERFDRPLEIILQVSESSLTEIDENPLYLVSKLGDYHGATRILLDRSIGRGQPMDVNRMRPYIAAVAELLPEIGISVAGGLGPHSTHLLEPLLRDFPDLSWDAQGRLRPSGNSLDPIDWEMAGYYLVKSLELLSR